MDGKYSKTSLSHVFIKLLKKRWVVERTFGWLIGYRQLVRDYELLSETKESIKTLENINLVVDLNANVITLTVILDPNAQSYRVRDKSFNHSQLGFVKFKIEDHHSGCHCPEGSLIIFNSKTASAESRVINYLEYAPAILNYFGVKKPAYMLEPRFTI